MFQRISPFLRGWSIEDEIWALVGCLDIVARFTAVLKDRATIILIIDWTI